ncbi:MAG: hypothetical protein V4760_11025 [Bdellovibrionota bacterium]
MTRTAATLFSTVLFFVVLTSTLALAQTPARVPTIEASDFQIGRSWIWDYVDASGKTYSTERYEVLALKDDRVLIEMSSSYDGGTTLTAHHRLDAKVGDCLLAYRNPAQKKPWKFTMYSLDQGKWVPFDPGKTLAFEEKFNCNPHVMMAPHENYLTVFSTFGGEAVFQQKLWRKLESSWFSLNGPERAVASRKQFGTPQSGYVFTRRP